MHSSLRVLCFALLALGLVTFATVPSPAIAAAVITSFSPGGAGPGQAVVVRGTGFSTVTAVRFNGINASFSVFSDSVINCNVPSSAATGPISVFDGTTTVFSPTNFFVGYPPDYFNFNPGGGPVGTNVTLQGSNFVGISSVKFNGVDASYSVNSNYQIATVVPVGATTGQITVANPAGTAFGNTFYLPPTISSVAPAGGPVGLAATITGTNVIITSQVLFNGVSASYQVLSETQVRAIVPPGATSGPVTVVSFAGFGTSPGSFYVGSAPTVVSFSPAGGLPGTLVSIDGSAFSSATGVSFNGIPAVFTIDSDSQIHATVPGSATTGLLAVTNPAGVGTSPTSFYVGSAPTVATFTPASGPVGGPVTVRGTGFTGATDVRFNGMSAASFSASSDTELVAVVAAGTTTGPIAVFNPTGSGSSIANFGVSPKVVSFTPASVPAASATGTAIIITGWNFTGAYSVTFNGTAAAFAVDQPTQITATVPAGVATGRIEVTTPAGVGQSASDFQIIQFVPPPRTPNAAWPYAADQNVPIGSAEGNQSDASVAPDSTGGAYIAWQDARGGGYDIYLQRVTPYGEVAPGWPLTGLPICTAGADQLQPKIIADQVGGVIIVWEDYRSDTQALYATRVSPAGQIEPGWQIDGNPVRAVSNTQAATLRIISDGASGAFVAWDDYRNGLAEVFVHRLLADGSAAPGWMSNGTPVSSYPANENNAALELDGQQGIYVAWRDSRDGRLRLQRMTSGGLVSPGWPADGALASWYGAGKADLVLDGQSGVFVFMTIGGLVVQRITSDGTFSPGWNEYGRVVMEGGLTQEDPFALSDGAGGTIVVCEDTRSGLYSIYGQRLTSTGNIAPGWPTGGVPLRTGSTSRQLRSVVPDGFGGAIAIWDDQRYGQSDIFAGRLMADYPASTGWPTDGAIVSAAPQSQSGAAAAYTGHGDVVVAWQDGRGSFPDNVYAQNIGVSGKRGNPEPDITSIADVANDQGGKLRIAWHRSYLDSLPALEIGSYGIWRLVSDQYAMQAMKKGARLLARSELNEEIVPGTLKATPFQMQSQYWEAVATVQARGQLDYSYVASTLMDSTAAGLAQDTYMVEAYAKFSPSYWSSPVDSGYSVDNLAPAMPLEFAVTLATQNYLRWRRNTEHDLAGYRVYRGTTPDFVPGPASLIATTSDTSVVDPAGGPVHYKLFAMDVHGNASVPAIAITGNPVDAVPGPIATRLMLGDPSPNPVATETQIRLAAPATERVRVDLFDLQGRRVRNLWNGTVTHEVVLRWDGRGESGDRLKAGLYFVKATMGGQEEIRRIVVAR